MQIDNTLHGISITVDMKSNFVGSESIINLNRRGHRKGIHCLAVAENDKIFVSGSGESAIIWDMNSLLPLNRLEADSMKDLVSAFFVPGDKYTIFGSKNGSLFIFDLATCELVKEYPKVHDGSISSIIGLPQNAGFVTVGSDKKVHFWEYQMVN